MQGLQMLTRKQGDVKLYATIEEYGSQLELGPKNGNPHD